MGAVIRAESSLRRVFLCALFSACGLETSVDDGGEVANDDAADRDAARLDAAVPDAEAPPVPTVRVLFIGNSYTYFNDLPRVVARLSEAPESPVRFEVAEHAPGGQTWEGHDADPKVGRLIQRGWDFVVLQDQSQQPWSVTGVKSALISLDQKIRAAGAETVLYMTWARSRATSDSATRFLQEMYVNRYYEQGAEAVGAIVAPVGRAWERALRDRAVVLHNDDGSHPNVQGTYLAACVFYATLTGRSPVGLGDGGLTLGVGDAEKLQRIAWETWMARGRSSPPLMGDWPLSSTPLGTDLIPGDALMLGDVTGPDARPFSATQFARGRYAAVPYFTGINAGHTTISFYAYRDDWSASTTNDQSIVGKWQGYELYQHEASLHARIATVTDASPPPIGYPVDGLAAGWHHVALTYDGARYALWIDRTEVRSATTSGSLRYYVASDTETGRFAGIAIGAPPIPNAESVWAGGASPYAFTGSLAELRAYDRALSAAEIQALP